MAVVRPLAGLRYDTTKVGDLAQVLAPPYDVISPAEQDALHARSPYNAIRLVLPKDADRGAASAAALRAWIEAGILVRDPEPALYLYSQRFSLPDGTTRRRDGIICRLQLEDFARGVVRPHERTLPGPKADRLRLIRATGANLCPIFGLYARRGEPVRALLGDAALGAPVAAVQDWHQLWRVTDARAIARFTEALAGESIIIADGHHRYETALAYRDEQPGNDAARFVMAYLANEEEEGVVILPTHRLVRPPLPMPAARLEAGIRELFHVVPRPERGKRAANEIDLVLPDRRLRLRARPEATARLAALPPVLRTMDVALVHGAILRPLLGLEGPQLDYTHDDEEAIEAVTSGRAAAAFLLNAPSMHDVRAVCLAGETMPEKSTYFYPKLASGMVIALVGPPWV
jgi:uncharacterized protein (DUF1015 family)